MGQGAGHRAGPRRSAERKRNETLRVVTSVAQSPEARSGKAIVDPSLGQSRRSRGTRARAGPGSSRREGGLNSGRPEPSVRQRRTLLPPDPDTTGPGRLGASDSSTRRARPRGLGWVHGAIRVPRPPSRREKQSHGRLRRRGQGRLTGPSVRPSAGELNSGRQPGSAIPTGEEGPTRVTLDKTTAPSGARVGTPGDVRQLDSSLDVDQRKTGTTTSTRWAGIRCEAIGDDRGRTASSSRKRLCPSRAA